MSNLIVSDIGNELHEMVQKNSHDYSPHYSVFENEFLTRLNNFKGLKNDIRVDIKKPNKYDLIKLSILLADFTSVFPHSKKHFLHTFHPDLEGRRVIGPKRFLDAMMSTVQNGKLFAGYGSVSEEYIEEIFDDLSPLINANKVFIRPEKIIYAVGDDHSAEFFPAESNGSAGEWRVIDESIPQESIPLLDKKSSIEQHIQLSQLLIPYLKGVSIKDYAKIIIDEEDLLSAFRAQSKIYLNKLKDADTDVETFRMDVLQPKIDLINRKFTTISNIHKMKVAGTTVGTSALLLLSVSQAGIAAALTQFISFGLGTVGYTKHEGEYQDSIDKLKDHPEYMLWKIGKK